MNAKPLVLLEFGSPPVGGCENVNVGESEMAAPSEVSTLMGRTYPSAMPGVVTVSEYVRGGVRDAIGERQRPGRGAY